MQLEQTGAWSDYSGTEHSVLTLMAHDRLGFASNFGFDRHSTPPNGRQEPDNLIGPPSLFALAPYEVGIGSQGRSISGTRWSIMGRNGVSEGGARCSVH